MQISIEWLKEFIDLAGISVEDIATKLTDLGLEVESIEHTSEIKGDVVIGEILDAQKHPDADTLRLCKVKLSDTPEAEALEIVCGAPNARTGIRVCVALVGSTLPKDFKIKKSKIRGVVSNGMLCSEAELGISDDHNQIIEIPASVPLGKSVAEHFGLTRTVLTLNITPNRADCFSYLGIARELSAKLNRPLLINLPLPTLTSVSSKLRVEVESRTECPVFFAAHISGLQNGPSPKWLTKRLEANGIRSIDRLVDATNYTMLALGQPMHAYDLRNLESGLLQVRRARNGEKLVTLDEIERSLCADDLVIADTKQTLALAGVMGGQNSGVQTDTTEVVLEAAVFHPGFVRKSAKRYGFHTDASHRFERGVDPELATKAIQFYFSLVTRIHNEENLTPPKFVGLSGTDTKQSYEPRKIALRMERLKLLSGFSSLDGVKVQSRLEGLGLKLIDKTANFERMLFEVPSWRADLVKEVDLIEEFLRLGGYHLIPSVIPAGQCAHTEAPEIKFREDLRNFIATKGCQETVTFPFFPESDLSLFLLPDAHPWSKPVRLKNPLSEQEACLRPTLSFGLLRAIQNNRRSGVSGAKLFEIARVFLPNHQTTIENQYFAAQQRTGSHVKIHTNTEKRANLPIERNILCCAMDPLWQTKSWNTPTSVAADYFRIKTFVWELLHGLGVAHTAQTRTVQPRELDFMHPLASAWLVINNQVVGYFGEIHPSTAKALDFSGPCTVFECDLDLLHNVCCSPRKIDAEERRFPATARDLAVLVREDLSYDAIESAFKNWRGKRNLISHQLFDVFKGAQIPEGMKSIALSFVFQSPKRTLTDKEVDLEMDLIRTLLKEQCGAELR